MERREPRVGLMPLYLALYDEAAPRAHEAFGPLLEAVRAGFASHGVGLVEAPTCRLEADCRAAVRRFEAAGVDLIVTLHLAYSPSMAAAPALMETGLPVLLLDTTLDADFGPGVAPERIMFNHGIHGVQDLACVLRRMGKPYDVAVGHVSESDVLERAAGQAHAAHAADTLCGMRVLRVGESFEGMGDFAVPETLLAERFGVRVTQIAPGDLDEDVASVSEAEVDAEVALDLERYDVTTDAETHRRSVRAGLGLRRRLEGPGYGAFSVNFLGFDRPVDTVPFLEASKAMARGLGYAGEGDVLTAALVGALNSAFPRTTFTEMFCPDWRGGRVFLSHMGEINPVVSAERAKLGHRAFPFTAAQDPAILTCPIAPGPAVLVNLAPGPEDSFQIILAPVTVPEVPPQPRLEGVVHGWVRPALPLEDFLRRYSVHGGTHHCALVYDAPAARIAAFARFAGIDAVTLGEGQS